MSGSLRPKLCEAERAVIAAGRVSAKNAQQAIFPPFFETCLPEAATARDSLPCNPWYPVVGGSRAAAADAAAKWLPSEGTWWRAATIGGSCHWKSLKEHGRMWASESVAAQIHGIGTCTAGRQGYCSGSRGEAGSACTVAMNGELYFILKIEHVSKSGRLLRHGGKLWTAVLKRRGRTRSQPVRLCTPAEWQGRAGLGPTPCRMRVLSKQSNRGMD